MDEGENIEFYTGKNSTHKCIQRFIRSLPGFEAVINLVRPRAHLNNTNEVRLQCRFLIQRGQKSRKMVANKMGLRAGGCVECGQGKPTNVLQQGCHYSETN